MEGNRHFLEFRALRKRGPRPALQSAKRPSAISPRAGEAVRSGSWLGRAPLGRLGDRPQKWTCVTDVSAPKPAWTAKSVRARFQKTAQQVLLYCSRGGNCGTFMPLSRVPVEFRIAVVWTRFVAAFSASSSVRFRILFTHAFFSRAVVCG